MTAESNNNVNDAEKDDLGKDNDAASTVSDNDGRAGRGAAFLPLGHSTVNFAL